MRCRKGESICVKLLLGKTLVVKPGTTRVEQDESGAGNVGGLIDGSRPASVPEVVPRRKSAITPATWRQAEVASEASLHPGKWKEPR